MAQCVDVNINVGGGSWLSEVSWDIADADGNVVASGVAGLSTVCRCDEGCYIVWYGYDSYGDGWNGNTASIADLTRKHLPTWIHCRVVFRIYSCLY